MSGITKMQRDALLYAAAFLDMAKLTGVSVHLALKGGPGLAIDADDAISALENAFDLKLGEGKFALRDAIAAAIGEVK